MGKIPASLIEILRAQLVNVKVGSGYLTQLDCMGPLCSQYLKIMRFFLTVDFGSIFRIAFL